jgi:hypothetical protein
MEDFNRPRRTDYLKSGPTGHVNRFGDIEIIRLYLFNRLPAVKRPHNLQAGKQEYFPFLLREHLELSAHSHCNTVHLQYKETLDIGLLLYRRGLN